METFTRFLYDFLSQFFSGIITMFIGIKDGVVKLFDISAYNQILQNYKNDFMTSEWIMVGFAIFIIIAIILMFVLLVFFIIRKYGRFTKKVVEQEELLDELSVLNEKVKDLMKEKEEILAMKVSQLGLKPGESAIEENQGEETSQTSDYRFSRLHAIDEEYKNYRIKDNQNDFDLPILCETFRNFAASRLHLYYSPKMMRQFIAALASTRLVILQGISGTGKTSLAYAWGKFVTEDSFVASVQPSWRDRTELFGYFNEFTKKFNETGVLAQMYTAGYTDKVYTVILDEMNISRVEYYFAEMLSILEMPNKNEWLIEIVPSTWPTDPEKIQGGKIKVPANMWYIGTINNDDSTFMVTDKVYDRAMPIDINEKGQAFKAPDTPPLDINYTYLDKVFNDAMQKYSISQESIDKIEMMDNYTIEHFRIAFGNRIVAHMKKFVPVYVGCGGDEIAGIDYFMAKKVLRKFEQLNVAYIRDEIDPYIDFLNRIFGKGKMSECIEYLLRLKKLT